MKIVTLHPQHDCSITAFEDDQVVFHWELERSSGVKHATLQRVGTIESLLCEFIPRLGWTDIDYLGFTAQPHSRHAIPIPPRTFAKPYCDFEIDLGKRFKAFSVNHHTGHMAGSYYTGPFESAAIFAYDGMGHHSAANMGASGEDGKMTVLGEFERVYIGRFYESIGHLFPFCPPGLDSSGKVMGLSSYGKVVSHWKPPICELFRTDTFNKPVKFQELADRLSIKKGELQDAHSQTAQNLMATIQECAEEWVEVTVRDLLKRTGKDALCIGGGCGLNVLVNSRLLNICRKIHINPGCNDGGLSMGIGLYYLHNVLGLPFKPKAWSSPYLGDEIQGKDILEQHLQGGIIDQLSDISVRKLSTEDACNIAAQKLQEGAIIGWAYGRAEIGPRALGNRSILCSPGNPGGRDMKKILNENVKKREWWRPFAPACLAERAPEWFEIDHDQPYMLEAPVVREGYRQLIPAVTHVDNTARVQTVRRYQNEHFYDLICRFRQLTGIPMVLNTSLNIRGNPIANHVRDMLRILRESEMDYLFIDDFLIAKK